MAKVLSATDVSGNISSTGTVSANGLNITGSSTLSGAVSTGNVTTSGDIAVTGNVTATATMAVNRTTATTNANLHVQTTNPATVGSIIQAYSAGGQSAALTEWRNATGTPLSSVTAAGVFTGNGSGLTNLDVTKLSNVSNLTTGSASISTDSVFGYSTTSGNVAFTLMNLLGQARTFPGGRLSLSTTPVEAGDFTSSGSINYVPYLSSFMPIWDGTKWTLLNFNTTSVTITATLQTTKTVTTTAGSRVITMTSTTGLYPGQPVTAASAIASNAYIVSVDSGTQITVNSNSSASTSVTMNCWASNYDIFGYTSSGTFTLEYLAWTDNTNRATALASLNGNYTKSGDSTRLYLGTVRIAFCNNSGVPSLPNTSKQRFVWNYFNRVDRHIFNAPASVADYAYTTGAWRFVQGDTTYKAEWVTGVREDSITMTARYRCYGTATPGPGLVGLGFDQYGTAGTTVTANEYCYGAGANFDIMANVQFDTQPAAGYHSITLHEFGATNTTFSTANTGCGVWGRYRS